MDYVTFVARYFPTGVDAHLYRKRLAPPGSPGKIPAKPFKKTGMPEPEVLLESSRPESMFDIGLSPFMGDGTFVQFGAIDIDDYAAGHTRESLAARLKVFGLPLSIIPSKSVGGFQLFMNLSEPIRARDLRACLKKMAVWLGMDPDFKGSKIEILPKQGKILIADGDIGTSLILPKAAYQDEIIANTRTVDQWNEILDEGEFADGPACLFPLFMSNPGVYRNNIIFQYGLFCRYKYPFEWERRMEEKNETAFDVPMDAREMASIIKSVASNDGYTYTCSAAPFESVCNKELCKTRKYGVQANSPVLSKIDTTDVTVLKTDPPTWFINIADSKGEDHRMSLTTEQLYYVDKFGRRCLEVIFEVPELPIQKQWKVLINEMVTKAIKIEVPPEMTEAARIFDQIISFLRTATVTGDQAMMVKNRVYVEGEENMTAYFRLADFHRWLEQTRSSRMTMNDLGKALYEYSQDGRIPVQMVKLQPLNLNVFRVAITDQGVRDHVENFFLSREAGRTKKMVEKAERKLI